MASLTLRRRCTVVGQVVSVVGVERPWVRTDAEITDGTASIVLRFAGRRSVPGFVPGRRVVAEGTPALGRGTMVMLNPLYSFLEGES